MGVFPLESPDTTFFQLTLWRSGPILGPPIVDYVGGTPKWAPKNRVLEPNLDPNLLNLGTRQKGIKKVRKCNFFGRNLRKICMDLHEFCIISMQKTEFFGIKIMNFACEIQDFLHRKCAKV